MHEAGDIVQPLRSGVLARERIAGDLFGLARGTSDGRRSADEITLFKSVGTALEDLAAAKLASAVSSQNVRRIWPEAWPSKLEKRRRGRAVAS